MIFPGLIDVHVHLRVPGGEHKEDYHTGSLAALSGGFTMLIAMPNTLPPIVSKSDWSIAQTKAQKESLCDVFINAGASIEHLSELPALSACAPALKVYMDTTYGPLRIQGLPDLVKIFEAWPSHKPIALHAEGDSVAIGIGLAACYNRPVHFCHISRKDEIELIAKAKKQGFPITCEVTPHHLFLTESDAENLGPLGDMRPTLASQADVDALWEHINTTIDCIASDHAPHTLVEKLDQENPPPGVPGLESTLPLMLTAASQGRLTYERIIELLYTNPRRIFNLPAQADTYVEIDEKAKYIFPGNPLQTKCGWSPFTGFEITGRIRRVVFKGIERGKDGIVITQ